MIPQTYTAPLDRLLTLGSAWGSGDWPDYLAFGIGPEHIPDLMRFATDPQLHEAAGDSSEVWAPGHAWRALAQLHAAEAAAPLAELFRRIDENGDDFVGEDLPEALGLLGPSAIPALMAYLADDRHGLWARVAAGHSLGFIGQRYPEARGACAAVLAGQLGLFASQDPALNGSLVAYLLDLKAVEAADVIEEAFKAGAVDEMVAGGWQKVRRDLGLADQLAPTLPALSKANMAVRGLSDTAKQPGSRPTAASPLAAEARLDQALREVDLKLDLGPKRKHHHKRK